MACKHLLIRTATASTESGNRIDNDPLCGLKMSDEATRQRINSALRERGVEIDQDSSVCPLLMNSKWQYCRYYVPNLPSW